MNFYTTARITVRPRPDACETGLLSDATVTGRQWRTARGLRIGQSALVLQNLYPNATLPHQREDEWWLLQRRDPVISERYGSLGAKVNAGRVTALVIRMFAKEGD